MQAMAQPRSQAWLDVGMESVSFKKRGHVLKIYVEMCMYDFYVLRYFLFNRGCISKHV